MKTYLYFANTDWYLLNFRLPLLKAVQQQGINVVCFCPAGDYVPALRAEGFTVVEVPMLRRSLNPWRELKLLNWLQREVRHQQPALLHGFTIKCAVYLGLVGRMLRAGPLGHVHAVAGMGYVFTSPSFKARVLRPVVRGLLKLAFGGQNSRVIVQNPDDLHALESAGLAARDNLRLIRGSGVDCRRFVPNQASPVTPAGPLTFLLVARLLWDKGVREFVEAAQLLRERGVPAQFVLAGAPDEGNPAAIPEKTVRAWVAQGLVQWLGHVADMPSLYATADVVVLPSHREGLPRTLIEAGAMAKPLIATDAPGCREVVIHDQTGLLVPLRDAPALADAMQRLSADAVLRQRLGAGAREHVLKHFEQDAVIAHTLAVYRELLPSL